MPYEEHIAERLEEEYLAAAKVSNTWALLARFLFMDCPGATN